MIQPCAHLHTRGMFKKKAGDWESQGIGRKREQDTASGTVNSRKRFVWCVSPLVLLLSSVVWCSECTECKDKFACRTNVSTDLWCIQAAELLELQDMVEMQIEDTLIIFTFDSKLLPRILSSIKYLPFVYLVQNKLFFWTYLSTLLHFCLWRNRAISASFAYFRPCSTRAKN